jgi:VWFA-related protein
VISTYANLVELVATVRDRHSHLTSGLQAADFEVLDNNQPREITFFSEQRAQPAGPAPAAGAKHSAAATLQAPPPEPRSIALFFDDAHASMLGVRMSAEAADRLVANNLPPSDKVGIFTASGTVSLDFTSDRKLLLAALTRLRPHPSEGVHSTTMCPTLGPSEAYIIVRHLDIAIEDAAVGELQLSPAASGSGMYLRSARSGAECGAERVATIRIPIHQRTGCTPHCSPPPGCCAGKTRFGAVLSRLPNRRV